MRTWQLWMKTSVIENLHVYAPLSLKERLLWMKWCVLVRMREPTCMLVWVNESGHVHHFRWRDGAIASVGFFKIYFYRWCDGAIISIGFATLRHIIRTRVVRKYSKVYLTAWKEVTTLQKHIRDTPRQQSTSMEPPFAMLLSHRLTPWDARTQSHVSHPPSVRVPWRSAANLPACLRLCRDLDDAVIGALLDLRLLN